MAINGTILLVIGGGKPSEERSENFWVASVRVMGGADSVAENVRSNPSEPYLVPSTVVRTFIIGEIRPPKTQHFPF